MPAAEFEALLERAAETGARRALREVGLQGQDAAEDVRKTAVRLITTAILLALMAGVAIRLKIFGSSH